MLNVTTTSSLGDLSKGRPNLGKTVHVAAYRLMHFSLAMTLSIEEGLECSGMPPAPTTQCFYDEGFLSGIFTHYAQCPMVATEIECWTMNGKNCRFTITKP